MRRRAGEIGEVLRRAVHVALDVLVQPAPPRRAEGFRACAPARLALSPSLR